MRAEGFREGNLAFDSITCAPCCSCAD